MINLPDDEVIRYLTANRRAMMEARDLVSGLVERQRMAVGRGTPHTLLFAPHDEPVSPDFPR